MMDWAWLQDASLRIAGWSKSIAISCSHNFRAAIAQP